MKNFALIENGNVTNLTLWSGDVEEWQPPEGVTAVEAPEGVGIGWGYVEGEFVAPEVAPVETQPSVAPASVTMRQARLALLAAGMLSQVKAAIDQADEATQIEWEYAATVDRASPLVAMLAASLGLDVGDLDNLFADAAER